jgi:hypothetical protein
MPTPPPYNTSITPNYELFIRSMMNYYDENNGYANALDDVINGNTNIDALVDTLPKIPVNPTIKPNSTIKPSYTPKAHPKDIQPKQTYDFMKVVNTYMQDDSKTTLDIANNDTYDLIIQQNTMYIFGSLACASLLIASIFISKSNS